MAELEYSEVPHKHYSKVWFVNFRCQYCQAIYNTKDNIEKHILGCRVLSEVQVGESILGQKIIARGSGAESGHPGWDKYLLEDGTGKRQWHWRRDLTGKLGLSTGRIDDLGIESCDGSRSEKGYHKTLLFACYRCNVCGKETEIWEDAEYHNERCNRGKQFRVGDEVFGETIVGVDGTHLLFEAKSEERYWRAVNVHTHELVLLEDESTTPEEFARRHDEYWSSRMHDTFMNQ